MIVNWLEWCDGTLTMHENVNGYAGETIRGKVFTRGETWHYESVGRDPVISGSCATRQECVDQLMRRTDARAFGEGQWLS